MTTRKESLDRQRAERAQAMATLFGHLRPRDAEMEFADARAILGRSLSFAQGLLNEMASSGTVVWRQVPIVGTNHYRKLFRIAGRRVPAVVPERGAIVRGIESKAASAAPAQQAVARVRCAACEVSHKPGVPCFARAGRAA